MSRISKPLPTWDEMLTAACRFHELVPGAVLGGGCAVILHAGHRMSHDADYSMRVLEHNFDEIQNIL